MKSARLGLLVLTFSGLFIAIVLITKPPKPSTTLVGLSASEQAKIEIEKARKEFDAALSEFAARLKAAAGDKGVDCGMLPMDDNSKSAIDCAARALHEEKRFSLAIETRGLDTTGWLGIVGDRKGHVTQYFAMADDLVMGAYSLAHPIMSQCESISFNASAPDRNEYVNCSVAEQRSKR